MGSLEPLGKSLRVTSSHPLPAKRIRALGNQAEAYGQLPRFKFRLQQPESYWDEFLTDLLIHFLPLIGFLAGMGLAAYVVLTHQLSILGAIGVPLLLLSLAA